MPVEFLKVHQNKTTFSVVRYGNVVGSRGSVIPLFLRQIQKQDYLTITDPQMTRFFIPLEDGVNFVLDRLKTMIGGEIFIPKIPSVRILDVAKTLAPNHEIKITGIRPGEKLHEVMIPLEDARNSIELEDYYILQPQFLWWDKDYYLKQLDLKSSHHTKDFEYRSDTNTQWLSKSEIINLTKNVALELGIELNSLNINNNEGITRYEQETSTL